VEPCEEVRRLGVALGERAGDVLAGTVARTKRSGPQLDALVRDSFERICMVSTDAVAKWMAGEGPEVALAVGREAWPIFGQLAAQRAAPIHEVTKRCLRWRDAVAQVLRESATRLEVSPEALSEALAMLQISLELSLVRVGECFETERQRTDEELARRQQELAFMATHDPLTELPNRTLVLDRIERMLVRTRRSHTPVAVLFIDLDNFKSINDVLGHDTGDELLKAVASRLHGVIRDADALGRLGGDEFVVVAEELSLAAGPELIAERVLDALKAPFKLTGRQDTPLTVTSSVGIAVGDGAICAEDLLRNADIAMYEAKWDGKHRYAVFESGMQAAVETRLTLLRDRARSGEPVS